MGRARHGPLPLAPRRRGALGVLVHVVEEVLDEWVARVMVHYRWHHDANTHHVVQNIVGREMSLDEAREFPIANWGRRACRATGTDDPSLREAAEREYLDLLGKLEAQLGETRYALGDRPTAVDAILLGGLRAHINNDPVPDLAEFPRAVAWDEREADRWDATATQLVKTLSRMLVSDCRHRKSRVSWSLSIRSRNPRTAKS